MRYFSSWSLGFETEFGSFLFYIIAVTILSYEIYEKKKKVESILL